MDERYERLKKYLEDEISQHQNAARIKGLTAHFLFGVVIVTSAVGLMNAAFNWFSKEVLSGIAVIPGIALITSSTFKFEARSRWNKMKQRKLEGLYRRLVFENESVSDISKELTKVLEELEQIRVALEKPMISK